MKIKTFLKLLFCQLVFYSGLWHLFVKCIYARGRHFPAVVLIYHGFVHSLDNVMETGPSITHRIEDFKREIDFLKKYFAIVSLDEVVDTFKGGKTFPRPTVAITIDDGYKNNFDLLFPVLKEKQIPVTIFLTTGVIGTSQKIWVDQLAHMLLHTQTRSLQLNGLWGKRQWPLESLEQRRLAYRDVLGTLKDVDIRQREAYLKEITQQLGPTQDGEPLMLSWDQIREMHQCQVSFGAHSCSHPILTYMPIVEAQKEIADSKEMIEKQLGTRIRHFAYPNGRPQDFNEELREFCKTLGFESISTCTNGYNAQAADLLGIKRMGVVPPLSHFAVDIFRRGFLNKGKG